MTTPRWAPAAPASPSSRTTINFVNVLRLFVAAKDHAAHTTVIPSLTLEDKPGIRVAIRAKRLVAELRLPIQSTARNAHRKITRTHL